MTHTITVDAVRAESDQAQFFLTIIHIRRSSLTWTGAVPRLAMLMLNLDRRVLILFPPNRSLFQNAHRLHTGRRSRVGPFRTRIRLRWRRCCSWGTWSAVG